MSVKKTCSLRTYVSYARKQTRMYHAQRAVDTYADMHVHMYIGTYMHTIHTNLGKLFYDMTAWAGMAQSIKSPPRNRKL
jgi:hypothetical protein